MFNYYLELHKVLIIVPLISALFFLYLFYKAKRTESNTFQVCFFVSVCIISLSIVWFYNDGYNSSHSLLIFNAIMISIMISAYKQRLIIFVLFFIMMTLLIVMQYYFPESFFGYKSESDRFSDILTSTLYNLVIMYLLINYVLNNYDIEQQKVIVEKKKSEEFNLLLEENNIQINNANIELEFLNENLVEHKKELEKYSLHLESLVAERTQDLVVAMGEIEKTSKLKTEIIANMNHEIRTPLNFIKMSASLIKMSINSNNSEIDLLDTLSDLNIGVNRLSRTLELFADLSSIKSGNFKTNISTFSLIPILENLYYTYKSRILELEKPIEIIFNCSLDDSYILADEQSTAKSIEFIIDNAVKFTNVGNVKIELLQNEDSKYQLIIEDTGIGIAEDYKDKIYEPFSQEDMSCTREYEGIGLSLSLAYEYALANKFDMSFESEKGTGTKFKLVFDKCNLISTI